MSRIGSPLLRNLVLIIFCGVTLGALVVAGGCGKKAATPTGPDPFANKPRTDFMSKDADIKTGMTYEEVVTLLGGIKGNDITMPLPADATPEIKATKQYQWIDDNKNVLVISFQNNKLISKNISKAL